MYSVIIPTMWRSERTLPLIESLIACEHVGEVIVIDNDIETDNSISEGVAKLLHNNYYKLIYLTNGQNNYVNPSWNMGARLAKYEYIALCNDDITFDPNKVFQFKVEPNTIVGMAASCYQIDDSKAQPIAKKCTFRGHGFGCLMLINRNEYKPIPESLKISFGDDYLFNTFETKLELTFLKIETEMSTTSRDAEFIAIAEQDGNVFKTLN